MIKMRNIPSLTKTASRIFLGTANPPLSTDEKTAYDLLDKVIIEAKEAGKIKVFGVSNWTHQRIETANCYAKSNGASVPEIAMRYVFSNEMNIFAVVSTTSAERLQMNIHASNNPLSAEDVAYLEA